MDAAVALSLAKWERSALTVTPGPCVNLPSPCLLFAGGEMALALHGGFTGWGLPALFAAHQTQSPPSPTWAVLLRSLPEAGAEEPASTAGSGPMRSRCSGNSC